MSDGTIRPPIGGVDADAPGSGIPGAGAGRDLDASIARVLMVGTYLSVALIALGVVLMVADGISPLDPAPPLAPGDLAAALGGLRPGGILALGLVGIILTPTARVTASLIGYVSDGERTMAIISLAILGVIALSVVLAIGLQG
jgi:uncharacterized membrane protein